MTDWFSAKIWLHFLAVLLLLSIKGLQPWKPAIFILVLTPVVFIPLPVQELFLVWFGWLAFVLLVALSPEDLLHMYFLLSGAWIPEVSLLLPGYPLLSCTRGGTVHPEEVAGALPKSSQANPEGSCIPKSLSLQVVQLQITNNSATSTRPWLVKGWACS